LTKAKFFLLTFSPKEKVSAKLSTRHKFHLRLALLACISSINKIKDFGCRLNEIIDFGCHLSPKESGFAYFFLLKKTQLILGFEFVHLRLWCTNGAPLGQQ